MTELTRNEKTALIAVFQHKKGIGGLAAMNHINTALNNPGANHWTWRTTLAALEKLRKKGMVICKVGWRITDEGRQYL
jgi:predicted NAD/FAD-dependent oxidoreductase